MDPQEVGGKLRRVDKPIIEKRRRARINRSLDELKLLVLEGMRKDPAKHTKLEKADVLEMAVRHLKTLLRSTGSRYEEGFRDCARKVVGYMAQQPSSVKQQLQCDILRRIASVEPPSVLADSQIRSSNRQNCQSSTTMTRSLRQNVKSSGKLSDDHADYQSADIEYSDEDTSTPPQPPLESSPPISCSSEHSPHVQDHPVTGPCPDPSEDSPWDLRLISASSTPCPSPFSVSSSSCGDTTDRNHLQHPPGMSARVRLPPQEDDHWRPW